MVATIRGFSTVAVDLQNQSVLWTGILQFHTRKKSNKKNTSLTNVFILPMNQITTCDAKGVARSDKPTVNCQPALVPLSSMKHLATIC